MLKITNEMIRCSLSKFYKYCQYVFVKNFPLNEIIFVSKILLRK